MRPVYANCSFALLDGFAFIPTRDGGSTTIFYFFLLHLCTTTVGTSVFWTTFVFLRNYLHLYDVSYSSQSERVCGKLYEERSYWTVPARALCFQCGTRFQICSPLSSSSSSSSSSTEFSKSQSRATNAWASFERWWEGWIAKVLRTPR